MKRTKTTILPAEMTEHPFMRYHKFRLPGDQKHVPRAPLDATALVKKLHLFTEQITAPVGTTPEAREDLMMLGASMAACCLLDWLSAHAILGNNAAQGQIAEVAWKLTDTFVFHARKHSPGIMDRLKRWPKMPGWISRAPEINEEMSKLCRGVDLGVNYPFPLAAAEKAKGKVHSVRSAHHELADSLHAYIESYRREKELAPWAIEKEFLARANFYVNPLALRMAGLPALSPTTVKDWIAVSHDILKDATDGNPASHPAFVKGGRYANLGMPPPESKRAEIVLWKRLAEAWKLRAKETTFS
ncbi:MAG: hypothetical protein JNJ83_07545 [Verrucomicrobiaceae bacterium]|nr:hypothetical protein [Verrucomicrobiaceae bacterium]